MYVKRFSRLFTAVTGASGAMAIAFFAMSAGVMLPVSTAFAQTATCASAWNSTAVYTAGNVVSKSNVNYKANWWTQGDDPVTHNGGAGSGQPWTSQGACGGVDPPPPPPPPTGKVCFYEHVNYAGASFCADADSSWVGSAWNDRASSVKVQGGQQVVLYQDINFGGGSVTLTADEPNLGARGFNDAMSSFKVSSTGGNPPQGFIYSAYKDVTINMDWNTSTMRTAASGTMLPLAGSNGLIPGVLPNTTAVTLAFATGQCGSESWGGVTPTQFVSGSIQPLHNAGVFYMVGTGGAAGSFKCASASAFQQFIARYYTPHMLGVDFDIEGGQSQADIQALVAASVAAQATYPNMRFSFTVATLAASDGSFGGVNTLGDWTVRAIQASSLKNYTINLMVMDYGSTGPGLCVVSGGSCDMGQSAVQAAKNLQHTYGVPLSHIELTPMIGQNDTQSEVVSLHDVDTISNYAVLNGLAGVNFWSLDRDTPCAGGSTGSASPVCNSVSGVPALGYSRRFLQDLGL